MKLGSQSFRREREQRMLCWLFREGRGGETEREKVDGWRNVRPTKNTMMTK